MTDLVAQALHLIRETEVTEAKKAEPQRQMNNMAAQADKVPIKPDSTATLQPGPVPELEMSKTDKAEQRTTAPDIINMEDEDEPPLQHPPVLTNTKVELVQIIQQWMDDHPGQGFPALAKYDHFSLESNFATEASLSDTDERVWITRLGILEIYQGWILEKPDGFYLLVRSQYFKNDGHIYFPWLGDDLGFSDISVAHHKDVPKRLLSIHAYARKRGLNADDVLNEHDISKQDLASEDQSQKDRNYSDGNSTLSSDLDPDDDEPLTACWDNAQEAVSQTSPSTTGGKRTRSGRLVKQPIRINEEPTDDDSEDASTSATTISNKKKTRRLQSPFNLTTPATTLPLTPSTRRSSSTIATPSSSHHHGGNATQTPPYSDLSTPFSQATSSTPLTLHYFLSTPSLGYIPTSYPILPSKKQFFKDAAAAFCTSGKRSTDIIAASIKLEGTGAAVVVRKDKSGDGAWEAVVAEMDGKGKGKKGKGKKVVGEVRCITGPARKK
ncbi:MAG: hypothetical protein Q9222_007228 [Ikaeria aurantiellina]